MPHVQTVLGPIDPGDLGFTLPHEHTQISLWHIPARWDYWQLTRDEADELELSTGDIVFVRTRKERTFSASSES